MVVEGNVIDKPLMSTVQWISVCAAIVVGTNSFNSIVSLIDDNKKDIKYQSELHVKDVEIMLHKLKAKGGRDDDNFDALWNEFNKLKENINNNHK